MFMVDLIQRDGARSSLSSGEVGAVRSDIAWISSMVISSDDDLPHSLFYLYTIVNTFQPLN